MDTPIRRSNRKAGRVGAALDRLATLATIDPRIAEHTEQLAEYHDSEAVDAYPLFHMAEIRDQVEDLMLEDPQLAAVLNYIELADPPTIVALMAAIRERITIFVEGSR